MSNHYFRKNILSDNYRNSGCFCVHKQNTQHVERECEVFYKAIILSAETFMLIVKRNNWHHDASQDGAKISGRKLVMEFNILLVSHINIELKINKCFSQFKSMAKMEIRLLSFALHT
jgi:hypothetical protein